ncbi:MAG TPA: winged helix-turn-helix transcriptional regulator [Nitrososphaera sp.]|jgi:DNA-binding Lrp family transcriptional regulator
MPSQPPPSQHRNDKLDPNLNHLDHLKNHLDELDLKIVNCMLAGDSYQAIAKKLKKPLSTVQRRTRHLLESGLIKHRYEFNYKMYGYKMGLLHIYLEDGNIQETAEKIQSIKDVLSVSIHIGNSDIVAEYACGDSNAMLELMAQVKHVPTVAKVVWSEEVSVMEREENKTQHR